jgi:hypothetical protein
VSDPRQPARSSQSAVDRLGQLLGSPEGHGSAALQRLSTSATSIVASSTFWLVLTVALTLALYLPALNGFFFADDFIFLRASRFSEPLSYVKDAFDFTGYDRYDRFIDFIRDVDISLPFLSYRPLYFLSLEGMYLAFGRDPTGYHVVSLLVHLGNTLLVWLIAFRLLRSRLGAHIAALIFALHPAYVVAVAWASGIGSPLAAMAALLALLWFMKSTDSDPPQRGWYVGSLVAYAAATLIHQEVIPWVAAFVAFYFLVRVARPTQAFAPSSWTILSPYLAIFAGAFALQSWATANTPVHEGAFDIGPHMLTHFKDFASASVYPTASGGSAAHFAAFIAMLLVLATLPGLAYLAKRDAALPRAELFVIVWFLAALAPLLTVEGFFGVSVLDRKLYAAGPALAILLVMFGASLFDLAPGRVQPQVRALAGLLLVLALVGGMVQAGDNRDSFTARAAESERFVEAVRDTYPSLPEGATLYVVNAPGPLISFGDVHLLSSIQAFYGRVDAYSISEERAEALESNGALGKDKYIFRYSPEQQ